MKGQSTPSGPPANAWLWSCNATPASASGSTQGTAYAIPLGQDLTVFGTVATGAGAILPAGIGVGEEYALANHGVNALTIYPPLGGKIGTLAVNGGYSLPAGKTGYFVCVSPNQFTANP